MTTPARAPAAVAALLAEIIDDASLFPPATLPMTEAVDTHASAARGDYRWMLGRFLCPVDRVDELPGGVVPRLGLVFGSWPAAPSAVVTVPEGTAVEAIEARLPDADVAARAAHLIGVARALGAARAWIEIPWSDFPSTEWASAAKSIAGVDGAGLKVRCGGERPETFPPPALLASIIAACRDADTPLKATAGLHHPFRHPDSAIGVVMHGFINLAVAVALARHAGSDEGEIAAVLAEDDVDAFALGADALGWRDRMVSAADVAETRGSGAFAGFGSCSFREPVDDLVALGILT